MTFLLTIWCHWLAQRPWTRPFSSLCLSILSCGIINGRASICWTSAGHQSDSLLHVTSYKPHSCGQTARHVVREAAGLEPRPFTVLLAQGWTDVFCKGLDCKYFGFRRLYGFYLSDSTVFAWKQHRKYIKECVWLRASETVVVEMRFEFHIMFVSWTVILLLIFFLDHLKMGKSSLVYKPYKNRWLWL